MSDTPTVLDISHWQSEPPWDELRRAGVIGVILKATEGTSYVDETFYQYAQDAADAGLLVASYHFLKHGNVRDQMRHYTDIIGQAAALSPRAAIDYEDEDCRLDDLEEAVTVLFDFVPDLQVAVYGSAKLTEDCTYAGKDSPLTQTSLWIARYSDSPPNFADNVWPIWSLWQYSDSGTVANWGPVDCNRFNGSDENLRLWFSAPPAPEPVAVADVEIKVQPGLRVVVNGIVIET